MLSRYLLAAAVVVTIASGSAQAQSRTIRQTRPPYRAPVSPYINLLRPNTDRRLLYQGIIRPQLEERRFQQYQQREIDRINQQSAVQNLQIQQSLMLQQQQLDQLQQTARPSGRIETGHRVSYMNRSKLFPGLR